MKKLIALLAVVAVAFAVQAGDAGAKDKAACEKAKSACPAAQAKKSCCPAAKDVAKKPVQSPKAGGQS